jgi:phosphonate transport system permease protein
MRFKMNGNAKLDLPPPRPFSWTRPLAYVILLLLLALTYWAGTATEFDLPKLFSEESRHFMADFLSRSWPPDPSVLPRVLSETLLTIQLAWVATIVCTLLSLPIGFLAASNIVKSDWIRLPVIIVLNGIRAVDALFLAVFFVSAVGLGPFAGTIALGVHSIGMLGKLFADAVEAIDPGPVEALESAGAGKLAMIRWAVWPQVAPHFISFFLFRFELNIRAAVVLGLVGAGGIGFIFNMYMRLFQYQKVATVLLVILVLVMAVDFFSSRLRRSVL